MPPLTAGLGHPASAPAAAWRKGLRAVKVASLVAGFILLNVVVLTLFPRSAVHPGSLLWPPAGPNSQQQPSQLLSRVRASPVFQLLQAAQQKAASAYSSLQHHTQLQLEPHCQLKHSDLRGVLALAAAVAAPPADSEDTSRALKLREVFQREWKAVLQPFVVSGQHRRPTAASTASNSSCRSVGLAPRSAASAVGPGQEQDKQQQQQQQQTTALLLVLGDWGSLDRMLRLYAINLFTIFAYARLHGYGLELYVHGEPLPAGMPIYFIKVLGLRYLFSTLGYQNVLYLDMDTFTSPHSAPPLALLYGEFPAASLLLQAEHNMCAATLLWRNTPDAAALLQAWWDVGASGCCPTFPHDQTALKHMLLAYAANITGRPWLYPASMQRRFKLPAHHPLRQQQGRTVAPSSTDASAGAFSTAAVSAGTEAAAAATTILRPTDKVLSTDYMPHKPSTWLKLRPRLQETHSALGFVGVDVFGGASSSRQTSSYTRTVLHNCLGMWWGCVPLKTPALLYHTGHWIMEDLSEPWLADRLLHSVADWSTTLGLQ